MAPGALRDLRGHARTGQYDRVHREEHGQGATQPANPDAAADDVVKQQRTDGRVHERHQRHLLANIAPRVSPHSRVAPVTARRSSRRSTAHSCTSCAPCSMSRCPANAVSPRSSNDTRSHVLRDAQQRDGRAKLRW